MLLKPQYIVGTHKNTGCPILISTVRTYLKAITYIDSDSSDLIASTGFAVVTMGSQFNKYFAYLFLSDAIINRICKSATGVSYPSVKTEIIAGLVCCVPPYIEQQEIVDYLDIKIQKIEEIISTINNQVAKLKELRKTLINDVVTGKIKVV